MSARREVLHQAEGMGFMTSLSDMKKGVATKRKSSRWRTVIYRRSC